MNVLRRLNCAIIFTQPVMSRIQCSMWFLDASCQNQLFKYLYCIICNLLFFLHFKLVILCTRQMHLMLKCYLTLCLFRCYIVFVYKQIYVNVRFVYCSKQKAVCLINVPVGFSVIAREVQNCLGKCVLQYLKLVRSLTEGLVVEYIGQALSLQAEHLVES